MDGKKSDIHIYFETTKHITRSPGVCSWSKCRRLLWWSVDESDDILPRYDAPGEKDRSLNVGRDGARWLCTFFPPEDPQDPNLRRSCSPRGGVFASHPKPHPRYLPITPLRSSVKITIYHPALRCYSLALPSPLGASICRTSE